MFTMFDAKTGALEMKGWYKINSDRISLIPEKGQHAERGHERRLGYRGRASAAEEARRELRNTSGFRFEVHCLPVHLTADC